jgi:hypothetical protein
VGVAWLYCSLYTFFHYIMAFNSPPYPLSSSNNLPISPPLPILQPSFRSVKLFLHLPIPSSYLIPS